MEVYVLPFKENIMYQDSNLGFKDKLRYIVLVGLKKALGPREKIKKEKKRKEKKSWWYRFLWPHPLLLLTRVPKANNYKYYIGPKWAFVPFAKTFQ